MKTRQTILTVLALLWMSLLAGCVMPGKAQFSAQNTLLLNTEWVLVSLNGNDPIEGKQITLRLGDTSIAGSAGCNTYGGNYTASGDSFSVDGVFSTEMACPEPQGILEQERAYLDVLDITAHYQVEDDRLYLYDKAGTQLLVFVVLPSVGEAPDATLSELSLDCTLDMAETYAVGEVVNLAFALHNPSDRPLYALSWYTPLEGMAGEILQVTQDDTELPYQGMLAKRGDPSRDEYIAIAPGETVSTEVDLQMGYDLSMPGSYQVQFTMGLQDVTDDDSLIPQQREDHQPQPLSCNTVNFSIVSVSEPTTEAYEPQAGFRRYINGTAGVSLWVPENWIIIEPGTGAPILQSFPQDKYIGGEPRQPQDTKCDLFIHPPDITIADVVPQEDSEPPTTIISEQEITLHSGQLAKRFEVDSMGRFFSLITKVNERVVVLLCFGELELFDEIAFTLGSSE